MMASSATKKLEPVAFHVIKSSGSTTSTTNSNDDDQDDDDQDDDDDEDEDALCAAALGHQQQQQQKQQQQQQQQQHTRRSSSKIGCLITSSCGLSFAPEAKKKKPPTTVYRGRCKYKTGHCMNERTLKLNGQVHTLCEKHRALHNRNQRKSDRKRRAIRRQRVESPISVSRFHPCWPPPRPMPVCASSSLSSSSSSSSLSSSLSSLSSSFGVLLTRSSLSTMEEHVDGGRCFDPSSLFVVPWTTRREFNYDDAETESIWKEWSSDEIDVLQDILGSNDEAANVMMNPPHALPTMMSLLSSTSLYR